MCGGVLCISREQKGAHGVFLGRGWGMGWRGGGHTGVRVFAESEGAHVNVFLGAGGYRGKPGGCHQTTRDPARPPSPLLLTLPSPQPEAD